MTEVEHQAAGDRPAHGSDRPPTPRRGLAKVHRLVGIVVVAGVVVVAGLAVAAVALGHWQARPVLSGSMRPALPIGGVAITESVPTGSLKVGDVAVFHPPGQPDVTYVHRIIWLQRHHGQLLVRTKGDANPVRDPWTLHVQGAVAYQVRYVVPLVGYAAVWVHSAGGRSRLLLLAAAALLVCVVSLVVELTRRSRSAGRRRAFR